MNHSLTTELFINHEQFMNLYFMNYYEQFMNLYFMNYSVHEQQLFMVLFMDYSGEQYGQRNRISIVRQHCQLISKACQ